MSLIKYLQTIKDIDPGKIEVENVRSILNTSRFNAKLICEMAVQENIFIKKYGLICPNDGRIIKEYDNPEEYPTTLTCTLCEDGDVDPSTFQTASLRKIEYYKLRK